MKVSDCKIIDLPKIGEPSGNLTFIESARHVPFQIARVYYLYDVPGGAQRGGHAHKVVEEFLVAMSGSFDVVLDDGCDKARFHLNRSFYGLYIPRMIWRELENFSSGSVCLVLASEYYDELDYFRDYSEFEAANVRTMRIPFLELKPTYLELKDELDAAWHRVMDSGWYLLS